MIDHKDENRMVLPWADDEPIPMVEEPDPDEDRELYPPERFIECPNCGEITYRLVNISEDLEEFECENCWHYGTFVIPNAKEVTKEIMKEFDRIIGVIKDSK